ncbi:molybdenum cofactor guanylyltransferase [Pseudolysobacter antarcticus]|uniref:Molybdenum cofactor guanylyltransferase n=1 Tax=Pseudolysobacter antarcticus TaxID=2511995 RepID=A0A411HJI0_9GAMM|nr:molybdenum cofactor guanylyltransferase MobA [Pseudolysobacter antarcticus]QBB70653.1 molybdenum cofactor guanylyltransferase [Pseudolysobacter antarcticus]
MNSVSITAAILAGGAAKRLGGHDKGLQLLLGKPLIAWVYERVSAQVQSIAICANRHVDNYAIYAPVVCDVNAGFPGPLAGIVSAFQTLKDDWLLTLPVDCPTPPLDLAQRLYEACKDSNSTAAFVRDGQRRQPLFALYHRDLNLSAQTALVQNIGVWQWQESIKAIAVDFSDQTAAFVNLNTPQDFLDFEANRHEC